MFAYLEITHLKGMAPLLAVIHTIEGPKAYASTILHLLAESPAGQDGNYAAEVRTPGNTELASDDAECPGFMFDVYSMGEPYQRFIVLNNDLPLEESLGDIFTVDLNY